MFTSGFKFVQIEWDQVKDLLGKVLQADKIIHEQQLGLYWYPPRNTDWVAYGSNAKPMAPTCAESSEAPPSKSRTPSLLLLLSSRCRCCKTLEPEVE